MNMQEALMEAVPDQVSQRDKLSLKIQVPEDVKPFSTAELHDLLSKHELEIGRLQAKVQRNEGAPWLPRAKGALYALRLHEGWIRREIRIREKREAQEHDKQVRLEVGRMRLKASEEATKRLREQHEMRMQRIKVSNDEDRRQIEVFKKVALEVFGQEMYDRLWELTNKRLREQET